MRIPFYKPSIGAEEIAEVIDTLKSGWLTTGPKTKQFEKEFAAYLQQKHAVAVNSCTAALHLALEAIGLKAGQGVIVPTMTFAATAEVVRYLGGRPILADCRAEDFNLDVADAERRINDWQAKGPREGGTTDHGPRTTEGGPRTTDHGLRGKQKAEMRPAERQRGEVVAIIPVHYGGQIGDVAGVQRLAEKYHLKVIEDAAHCCPAYYKTKDQGPKTEDHRPRTTGLRDYGTTGGESRKQKTEGGATPHPALSPDGAERALASDTLPRPPHDPALGMDGPLSLSLSPLGGERVPKAGEGAVQGFKARMPSGNSLPGRGGEGVWKPVGASADISCYSFYANKCITTGEGGMACTENDEYADRMRIMSLHGISRDAWKRYTGEGSWYYEIVAPGFKYNLTDIAAAIGIHQLRKAELFLKRRSAIAVQYRESLKEVEEIILPQVQPDRIHSWHLYVIRLKLDRLQIDRAQFIAELQQRGIGASVHWLPLHIHPYYRETYGYAPQDLPTAWSLYPEIITLPLYPDMSEGDVAYVCDSIKQIIAQNVVRNIQAPV